MPTFLDLLGSYGWLAFGFLGGLVSQPGAAGHFHAAFLTNFEARVGDDIAYCDDFSTLSGRLLMLHALYIVGS